MNQEAVSLTPLMRQYHDIKVHHQDALVLFQVGDFYELFFDDAKKAASFLGIALTSRGMQDNEPIPLCGVPVHTINHYLVKLVKGGFRVVVCDQLTTAQPGKIVERGITQVFTPGTLIDANLIEEKSASYLAALSPVGDMYSIVFVELLTGQLSITTVPDDERMLEAELARFSPDEVLISDTQHGVLQKHTLQRYGYIPTLVPDCDDTIRTQAKAWIKQRDIPIDNEDHALFILYRYLDKHYPHALTQIKSCFFYKPEDFLLLDAATQRNLELVMNSYDGSRQHSLLSVLDSAVTAMGSRMVKKWLLRPLFNKKLIEQRMNVVTALSQQHALRDTLRALCGVFGDFERIVGRIALRRAHSNDYRLLAQALQVVPELILLMHELKECFFLIAWRDKQADFSALATYLSTAINDDSTKDWRIKTGFHAELDRLRLLVEQGTRAIAELEKKEQEATGISSLKIRYNRTQGYGIEVTKPNVHLVPVDYMRTQSLINRERFVTQELKDLEYDLTRAHGAIEELENLLFTQLCSHIETYLPPLRLLAQSVAYLDALASFAYVAVERGYIRPVFHDGQDILIAHGRHPVVELTTNHHFIANDTNLSRDESLWIITGPNMGGKSTYLRQVALLCIMAQAGSFVPAQEAKLPLIDRIFTRLGAADKVAEGKSTFLVEMEETALICQYATPQSLVVLDEVGRGTSTYDGLAIAYAVVEYIYTHVQARCLFATHYHELTRLTALYPGIASYYVASRKTADGIVLLHKVVKGATDGSFGIEVARRAGLPAMVIERAEKILNDFKNNRCQNF